MKKLYSTIMIMALILVCTTARADIFVYDDGTQLTISWSKVSSAFYYDVDLINLTKSPETTTTEGSVFDPFIIISGLVYHDIYEIIVKAYDNDGKKLSDVGKKCITFALDESSGNCVCVCPDLPKKVFFGLISPDWWTAIAINNAGDESQSVVIKAGNVSNKIVVVSSHSTEAFLLEEMIEDTTPEYYPITYETDSPDVGVTVLVGYGDGFSSQN